jgi:hypothetical protein
MLRVLMSAGGEVEVKHLVGVVKMQREGMNIKPEAVNLM